MKNVVAIMGCGWLGLPLAQSLIINKYDVHGSTTSEEKLNDLRGVGIIPFLISLSEESINGNINAFLDKADTLIINIPPKLRGKNTENYVKKMELLHNSIKSSQIQKLIFVSSTSVYGDVEGMVNEETDPQPNTESGKQLLASENIFREDKSLQTTVIRFGGLIGKERHPINMLSGKKDLSNGNYPINLIHLNDCIQIIESIIKNNWWNEVFNGVFPFHPSKRDYYTLQAREKGLRAPVYKLNTAKKGKVVSADKLILGRNYTFLNML